MYLQCREPPWRKFWVRYLPYRMYLNLMNMERVFIARSITVYGWAQAFFRIEDPKKSSILYLKSSRRLKVSHAQFEADPGQQHSMQWKSLCSTLLVFGNIQNISTCWESTHAETWREGTRGLWRREWGRRVSPLENIGPTNSLTATTSGRLPAPSTFYWVWLSSQCRMNFNVRSFAWVALFAS